MSRSVSKILLATAAVFVLGSASSAFAATYGHHTRSIHHFRAFERAPAYNLYSGVVPYSVGPRGLYDRAKGDVGSGN